MTESEALLLTWLFELPVALVLARVRDLRLVVVVVVASLVTHPFVWLIGTHVPAAWWWPVIFVVEASVGVIEGLLLWRFAPMSLREGLLIGIAMNGVSFSAGLFM